MLDALKGRGLLIHHWDTDGLCSAALLLDALKGKDVTNWTPTLGAFYLTPEQIEMAHGYDYVIIADIALPAENVREINEFTPVIMFDHHHMEPIDEIYHFNPVAYGESTSLYPSCTWVIKENLGLPLSLYVVLGFAADRAHKLKDNPRFWTMTEEFLETSGATYEELLELVALIDANYKTGDREAVIEVPRRLMEYTSRDQIRENLQWARNQSRFEEKMDQLLAEEPLNVDGVLVKRLDTEYSVISAVTRSIAWGTGKDTIVVNTGAFKDDDQLYSRSSRMDMQPMIRRAKELGFNAGGKKDVLGAIIPKDRTEEFLEELLEFFKEK